MRKRRVLSCVLSAFIICGIICGPTSVSATYNTLDDLEIDPWGDLEDIQGFEPPTPELVPDDFEPVTMFPDMELFALNGSDYWIFTPSEDLLVVYRLDGSSRYSTLTYTAGAQQFNYQTTVFELISSSVSVQMFALDNDSAFNIQLLSNKSYEAGEYTLSGDLFSALVAYIGTNYETAGFKSIKYPSSVEIFSGSDVLATFSFLNGNVTVDEETIVLENNAVNIGYRFYFPATSNNLELLGSSSGTNTLSLAFECSNNLSLEKVYVDETKGLLETIIANIVAMRDGILDLPQNIANFILEGLQGLFIPDQEELTGLMDRYDLLFEERLGFIYQMFSFVVDAFTTWVDTMKSGEDYSFVFPGISVPYNGDTLEVLPETEVSLENAAMDVLRPVLGTVIGMVAVVAFGNTCFDLVVAFMSGQSYFQFISGKKEEDAA